MIDLYSLIFLPSLIFLICLVLYFVRTKLAMLWIGFALVLVLIRFLMFGSISSWNFHLNHLATDQDNIHEYLLAQNIVTENAKKDLLIGDSVLHSFAGHQYISNDKMTVLYNFLYSPYELLSFLNYLDKRQVERIGIFTNIRTWASLDRNKTLLFNYNGEACYHLIKVSGANLSKDVAINILHKCMTFIFPEIQYFSISNAYINGLVNQLLGQSVKGNYASYLGRHKEKIKIAGKKDVETSLKDNFNYISLNLSAIEEFIKLLEKRKILLTIIESPLDPLCVNQEIEKTTEIWRTYLIALSEKYPHFKFQKYENMQPMVDCIHYDEKLNSEKKVNLELNELLFSMFGEDNAVH